MASHGEACPECVRLEREYAEVAGRLAFALDPVSPRPGLEDRVVAAAARESAPSGPPAGADESDRGTARGWRLRPLVAVAASIVLLAVGFGVGALAVSDGGPDVPRGVRAVAFEGEAAGGLAVAFAPDGEGVYLLGSGLEAPPQGTVYELWMFQGGTPVPATCFSPSEDGSVFEFVDAEVGTSEAMAVTIEPSSCPSAPTTAPILTAELV
jgi:hypothetical protein